jgi:hypothetical protein
VQGKSEGSKGRNTLVSVPPRKFSSFLIIMMIQKGKRIRTSLSIQKFSKSRFLALHSVVQKPMYRNVFGCDYFQYESKKYKEWTYNVTLRRVLSTILALEKQ